MVSLTNIKLNNPNINSGADVQILATGFQLGYKRIGRVEPIAGQKVTGTDFFAISSGDISGVENPIYTLRFTMDMNDSDIADQHAVTGQTYINIGLLKEFYRIAAGQTTMNVLFGDPLDQIYYKNYDGSSNTIKIIIESITGQPDQSSKGSHIINIQMVVREVV